MSIRDSYIIEISVPVRDGAQTLPQIKERETACQKIMAVINDSQPIGYVDGYSGVHEVYMNQEGFTPDESANPVQGEAGSVESCAGYQIRIYAPADISDKALEDFCEKICDVHPWNAPIIAITQARLFIPKS